MSCGCLDDGVKCEKPGRWTPVLRLFVTGELPPIEAVLMGVAVCDDHRATRTEPKDWIADDGWAKLSSSVKIAGRALPTRDLTKIGWQPIDAAPMRSPFWGI